MKSNHSRLVGKPKHDLIGVSRMQLVTKSIVDNIQTAKDTFTKYKSSQYCEYCSKLNDSAVTFNPIHEENKKRLTKSRTHNECIQPSSSGLGILQAQNLRLIQANQRYDIQREQLVESVQKVVEQCRVYVGNYDCSRTLVGLDNVLRAVRGNKMVGFMEHGSAQEQWSPLENYKVKAEFLEQSLETVKKVILQRSVELFPNTKKTLEEKYYLSLEDFDRDISNIQQSAHTNSNLLGLFRDRLRGLIQQFQAGAPLKSSGLCEQEFSTLRLIYQELQRQREESRKPTRVLEKSNYAQTETIEREEPLGCDFDSYTMMLSQCLIIQELLSQQVEQSE